MSAAARDEPLALGLGRGAAKIAIAPISSAVTMPRAYRRAAAG